MAVAGALSAVDLFDRRRRRLIQQHPAFRDRRGASTPGRGAGGRNDQLLLLRLSRAPGRAPGVRDQRGVHRAVARHPQADTHRAPDPPAGDGGPAPQQPGVPAGCLGVDGDSAETPPGQVGVPPAGEPAPAGGSGCHRGLCRGGRPGPPICIGFPEGPHSRCDRPTRCRRIHRGGGGDPSGVRNGPEGVSGRRQ